MLILRNLVIALIFCSQSLLATEAESVYFNIHPQFSPDGNKIVFYEWKQGESFASIMLKDLASGKVSNLTNNQFFNGNPTWHPDGEHIVFSSARPTMQDDWQLYQLNLSTLEETKLTHGGNRKGHPHWHPNGKSIVFQQKVDSDDNRFKTDLFALTIDSGKPQRLTKTNANEFHPKFANSGKYFVYDAATEGQGRIYKYDLAEGKSSLLFEVPEGMSAGTPAVSPDEKFIAYALRPINKDNGTSNIHILNMATGKSIQLTDLKGRLEASGPNWSPNGKILAFHQGRERNFRIVIKELSEVVLPH